MHSIFAGNESCICYPSYYEQDSFILETEYFALSHFYNPFVLALWCGKFSYPFLAIVLYEILEEMSLLFRVRTGIQWSVKFELEPIDSSIDILLGLFGILAALWLRRLVGQACDVHLGGNFLRNPVWSFDALVKRLQLEDVYPPWRRHVSWKNRLRPFRRRRWSAPYLHLVNPVDHQLAFPSMVSPYTPRMVSVVPQNALARYPEWYRRTAKRLFPRYWLTQAKALAFYIFMLQPPSQWLLHLCSYYDLPTQNVWFRLDLLAYYVWVVWMVVLSFLVNRSRFEIDLFFEGSLPAFTRLHLYWLMFWTVLMCPNINTWGLPLWHAIAGAGMCFALLLVLQLTKPRFKWILREEKYSRYQRGLPVSFHDFEQDVGVVMPGEWTDE